MNADPSAHTAAETAPVLLECRQLQVGYSGKAILPPFDLTLRRGEFWAVIGRNGSGKSTWFKTLLSQLPPVAGTVHWHRPDLRLAYIAQRGDFDNLFPARVKDVVAMGTERRFSFLVPWRSQADLARVQVALERTETQHLAERSFRDLSEGQKQRVLLARVVAGQPDLALLDEPTAALDARAEMETLALIDRLRRQYSMAVLMVSHFLGVASHFAEQVLLFDQQRQRIRSGPPAVVMPSVDFAEDLSLTAAEIDRPAPAVVAKEAK